MRPKKRADALTDDAKAKAKSIEQQAKQQSDQIIDQAKTIKESAISGANDLSADAQTKTQAIKDSMKQNPPAQNGVAPASNETPKTNANP